MKRRYTIEQIIGKRTRIRLPRIQHYLKLYPRYIHLTAACAEAEPPLSILLRLKRGIY